MKEKITDVLQRTIKELFDISVTPVLTRPDEQFGDYATNAALQLSKQLGKNPREIAETIAGKLQEEPEIATATVAGPGFINVTLTDTALLASVNQSLPKPYEGQTVVAEYSDPNPFKVLHAGHLYTSVVGDALANLFEFAGASVHRVNFGGDVGLHVAKMLWAITQQLGEEPERLNDLSNQELNELVSASYVSGTNAYEENEDAKQAIVALNKQIYAFHSEQDHESPLAQMYWKIRSFYYDVYFKEFYDSIGTKFEKFYPESETAPLGLKTVQEQLKNGVYKESDGAVVFVGEPYGLHTRVFINSAGLPTYEAKDVGLIMKKYEDFHFDKSVIITGNDIIEYMKVVQKSIEQFAPKLAEASIHLTHGIVKLEGGTKMSSRKGNILRAQDVLDAAKVAHQKAAGNDDQDVVLGAVKYAFLKQRIGGDIIYDPEESVSLAGNSGPYLQYALVRANSIIAKATQKAGEPSGLNNSERSLMRKLSEFPEAVLAATTEYMPHIICTYLYELAQTFNRFYENNRVVGDEQEAARLGMVMKYKDTLQKGLSILNIPAPEQM